MTNPIPKPGILDIAPYVGGESKVAADVKTLMKLSSNENTMGPSPKAVEVYNSYSAKLNRYPDGSALELRTAIGKAYGLNPDRIVCGAGSDELICFLVRAYAGVGDEVLYTEHGFLMYKIYAQSAGATPVVAPEKNLTADVNEILAHVTERTRIVFIANPNNPTGSYLPASEMKRLRSGLPPDVILAIDDAYAEFADRHDYSSGEELVDQGENTVVLRTFSKIYGLSSLRIGWGYFPASIADVMNRVRGPFNVSGTAIATAAAAVADVEYTAKMKAHNSKWRQWITDELSKAGIIIHPSQANFLLMEFPVTGKTSDAANDYLMARGIIPRQVTSYGLPLCLRVTIGTEEENRAVVEALQAFMA